MKNSINRQQPPIVVRGSIGWIVCLIALGWSSGCSQVGSSGSVVTGFIVLGSQGRDLGIAEQDTVPEISSTEVPRVVRNAGERVAKGSRDRVECNRYFDADELFLLVTSPFCGSEIGKITDARTVAAIRSNGILVRMITWYGDGALVPPMRFDH
jgi:hypothetical protein